MANDLNIRNSRKKTQEKKDSKDNEGDWRNGKSEGKGIYYYHNGDRYEGDYKNHLAEGKGIYYYNNGDRIMIKEKEEEFVIIIMVIEKWEII